MSKVNKYKFPVIKILSNLPKRNSLFETALVAANDQLVQLYLNKKITYSKISKYLLKLIHKNEIKLLKKKSPRNINEILKINDLVRTKINMMSI